MQVKRVTFKVGPMRKEQDWSVYPESYNKSLSERLGTKTLFVQCSKRALLVNVETKKGFLSDGKSHPGFWTTDKRYGAKEVDIPQEIIDLFVESEPKSGDKIGSENSIMSIF